MRAYGECRDGAVYGDSEGVHCESKVFENIEFGYHKIVVERPLRLAVKVNNESLEKFKQRLVRSGLVEKDELPEMSISEALSMPIKKLPRAIKLKNPAMEEARFYFGNALEILEAMKQDKPYLDIAKFEENFNQHQANKYNIEFSTLYNSQDFSYPLFEKCPEAEIVYDSKKKPVPDTELRDTENVPMKEDIDDYFAREVLPYVSDAWIDKTKTKVGYEIPMTRYFYKYEAPEPLEEISTRIHELELDVQDSLDKLFDDEV